MRYHPLIREPVIRDIKVKYHSSFPGYLWSLPNPLMMTLMALVFSGPVFMAPGMRVFSKLRKDYILHI